MTTDPFDEVDPEFLDPAFLALLASLEVEDRDFPPEPPRTPPPPPPPYTQRDCHTFPSLRPRTQTFAALQRPTVYQFQTPSGSGSTEHWDEAGFATQGVPGAKVRKLPTQTGSCCKKTRAKKAADEVQPLVSGVPCSIFRGYRTKQEATAAFLYAQERSWVRVAGSPPRAIPALPHPAVSGLHANANPLNSAKQLDDRWFVVYRGITPGVYRSHLECQLNTAGVPNALHEAVTGRVAAHAKFAGARQRGHVAVASAPVYSEDFDVFA
ncbi:hypothetical protein DFH07DRAFT_777720 [Mycena maculata]|uniref:Ribonuclease H1 N-terminal domain-containing protein n=1 Tax=Mycena maculata TaxID=230809 RepID=A0AAD7IGB7_9AGAR|nr:hypothetical protein DFH07DRAFT_777720 [Mycena maculata]